MSTVAVCDQLLIATLALDPNGIVNKGDSNFNDLTNAIVSDLDSYRHFLRYRGKEALVLIDALQQALLPNVALSQTERANFLNALLRLSKRSVLLPSSFSLTGIENVRRIYRLETWCTDIFEGIHGGRKVFLKRYRLCNDSWTKEERDELLNREAILWANHQHSGVLPFLGVFKREDAYDPGLYLVSPFMEQGTIVEYLSKTNPTCERRLLMIDVLEAVSFLHTNDIIHGDLKGANILVKPSGRICLADLGFSRLTAAAVLTWTSIQSSALLGTKQWQAPELVEASALGNKFLPTKESDIYSVGCVGYEIFTGKRPLWDVPGTVLQILDHVVRQKLRPTKPQYPSDAAYTMYGLTEEIWFLIASCWAHEPSSRPSAVELSQLPCLTNVSDGRPSDDA